MGRYRVYAEYKDSRVERLGAVPSHWKTKPVKYCASYNDDVLDESTPVNYEIEYIDISSVSSHEGIGEKQHFTFEKAPSRARRRVKHGDVIVSTVRTYLEAISPVNRPTKNTIASTGFAVIRPQKEMVPGFAAYALRARYFIDEIVSRSTGVSYPAINASELVAIPVSLPPEHEQTQIAAFLDRETAKIDRLIAKQEALIELLGEKRQAVISNAVTKGLDPNAPMKDSSVEWLGEIPAHWEAVKLKYFIDYLDSGVSVNAINRPIEDGEIGVLKTSCVYTREFRPKENKTVVPEEIERTKCPVTKGAVIISRMNTPELVGAAAYVAENYPDLFFPDRLWKAVFFKNKSYSPELLAYLMRTRGYRFEISSVASGTSSSMQNIAKEDVLSIAIPVPSEREQADILSYIKMKVERLEAAIEKSQENVSLLQERRTALISAAVTGKIDVREEAQQ